MKKVTKVASVLAVMIGLFTVFATKANAQTQTAQQTSTPTVNCTTGAYGQSNNCYAITNQTITQTQNIKNGSRSNLYHQTVDTGMNTSTTMAAVATLVTTVGGAVITLKSKISA